MTDQSNEYLKLGLSKRNAGDYQGALIAFNEAIEIDPDNSKSYIDRGICNDLLGDPKSAIDDYNIAIEIDPKNWTAYYSRAVTLRDSGLNDLAIRDFTKTIELNPECIWAYNNRGSLKYKESDIENACSDWKKAADLGDKDAHQHYIEYCTNSGSKESDLPISKDAFCVALEVITCSIYWKLDDELKEMTPATYTTLWNIMRKSDPEIVYEIDEIKDNWDILIELKNETTELESLKKWIEYAFIDFDEMEEDWEIGTTDSCQYPDKESFLSDLDLDMIMFCVHQSWKDSLSEEKMERVRKIQKGFDGAREEMKKKSES